MQNFQHFVHKKDAGHKTNGINQDFAKQISGGGEWTVKNGSKLHSWCQLYPGFISQSCSIYREIFKIDFAVSQERSDSVCTLGQKNLVTQADIWALNNPGRKFTLNNPGWKFTEAIYSLLFLFGWDTITLFLFS